MILNFNLLQSCSPLISTVLYWHEERKIDKKINKCKRAQSYLTFCDPMNCSPPGSSVHGISRQEYWSGLPFPTPGDLFYPGIEPTSLESPALARGFFTTSITWEAQINR